MITRAKEQALGFQAELRDLGLANIILPAIEIEANRDPNLAGICQRLASFDWIIFPSQNAVMYFEQVLQKLKLTLPAKVKIAAQGAQTARSIESVLLRKADLVPEVFTANDLLDKFTSSLNQQLSVLIPCALEGRDTLDHGLSKIGAQVQRFFVYRTVRAKDSWQELLSLKNNLSLIFTFFSPSAFLKTVEILQDLSDKRAQQFLSNCKLVSIGPVTSQAIKEYGFEIFLESSLQDSRTMAFEIAQKIKQN